MKLWDYMNVPKIIEYTKLEPGAREKYLEGIIRETIFLNKDGVGISQLLDSLPFSRKVLEKHLNKLLLVNEIYEKEYGRTKVYFPNSRAIHSLADFEVKIRGKYYRSVLIDNVLGKFVYIQEYETGTYGLEVKGGLMIPLESFKEFIDFVHKIQKCLEEEKDGD
jgi:hypothetical protein